jgi:hypothetical protein
MWFMQAPSSIGQIRRSALPISFGAFPAASSQCTSLLESYSFPNSEKTDWEQYTRSLLAVTMTLEVF